MTGNGMMPGGGRGGASSGAVAPPRGGKFRRAPAPAGPAEAAASACTQTRTGR